MLSALYSGFLWALLPLSFFAAKADAAPANDVPPAQSFYVSTVPDLHQDPNRPLRIYAGHLSSDANATAASPKDLTPHLYFVMVKPRRTADKDRVIFWFNGGPGCSSFDGLMMEVGPWRVDGKGGLQMIEGGWEEYTTVVYVDQPVGTGFSYTSSNHYLHDIPEAASHLLQFMENFYGIFPEYRTMDTYFAGESFAGQYIPYFANALLDSSMNIPLRGVAIGNGWMHGRTQYPSFLDYAVKHGITELNSDDYKRGKEATDKCMVDLDETAARIGHEPVHTELCESVLQSVVRHKRHKVDNRQKCLNIYDVRLDDDMPACGLNWPPDLKDIGNYLHRPDFLREFHATRSPSPWVECRGKIHTAFNTKHTNSSVTVVPRLLERIPMMLFAGDQDLICNYVGIESMIQAMTWNGEKGLGTVQTQSWSVNNTAAGTWVTSRNLTYVKIFNASHMVGYDLPHVSHDMMLRFMGVNFSAITDGSVRIPSALGSDAKPVPILATEPSPTPAPGKTKEQNKAMWEAYYNAGSAALVLVIIAILIGGFVWWRSRKGKLRGIGLPVTREDIQQEEEHIPLTQSNGNADDSDEEGSRQRKGKGRATGLTPREEIFGVGDDEDDDVRSPRH